MLQFVRAFTDSQTVLGPVILLGPQSVSLKKPVVVSFQHCASIKHGQWALSVYSSDSSYDEPPQWQVRAPTYCDVIVFFAGIVTANC